MSLEALASSALPAFVVYDTISASSLHHNELLPSSSSMALPPGFVAKAAAVDGGAGGATEQQVTRRKRRRRQRSCKNKEEAESQRMTHIAVERNRRRLMNDHLAVLRSLMPESYIQRGDQASIVGGAIDFVKELEQHLQSLEVQKRALQQKKKAAKDLSIEKRNADAGESVHQQPPFAQFFSYPQYTWCHSPSEYPPQVPDTLSATVADIEVTQLLKMVAGLQALSLSILHLNVTTLDSMVLYSMSVKVEEGCNLTTVDDIAAAVHHMLTLFEAEAATTYLV
uniref:BHLH transcription factor n=1 Tax=Dracaena cambodiana TaxID=580341 RepID=A0A7M3UQG8_9ASPA|nr:bHLH transcription factor [Dracaena cambodiana]